MTGRPMSTNAGFCTTPTTVRCSGDELIPTESILSTSQHKRQGWVTSPESIMSSIAASNGNVQSQFPFGRFCSLQTERSMARQ